MSSRRGIIRDKKGKNYLISFEGESGCETCSMRGICRIGGVDETWLEGEEGLEPGDRVEVTVGESRLILLSFLVFIVPIILFFGGYFLLAGYSQLVRIVGGLVLFSLYFLFLNLLERKKLRSYSNPKIRKLPPGNF